MGGAGWFRELLMRLTNVWGIHNERVRNGRVMFWFMLIGTFMSRIRAVELET